MRSQCAFIILVLIAAGLIFVAPILIGLLSESGRSIDAPTVTPQLATITPEDFANFDLMRGYALTCLTEAALYGDGAVEMCEVIESAH